MVVTTIYRRLAGSSAEYYVLRVFYPNGDLRAIHTGKHAYIKKLQHEYVKGYR